MIETMGDLFNEFDRIDSDLREEFRDHPFAIQIDGDLYCSAAEYQKPKRLAVLSQYKAVRKLALLCESEQRDFNRDTILQYRAALCISKDMSEQEVDALSPDEFVAMVRPASGVAHKADNNQLISSAAVDKNTPVANSKSGAVELYDRQDSPFVNGNKKCTLTQAQYDVVLALLNAGEKGLTKDQLAIESKHTDARKTLKRLEKSDPDWESVIPFPGKSGKGYRIL
jgi:hypothetical protein